MMMSNNLQAKYDAQSEAFAADLIERCGVAPGDRVRVANVYWDRAMGFDNKTIKGVVAELSHESIESDWHVYHIPIAGDIRVYFDDGTDELLSRLLMVKI